MGECIAARDEKLIATWHQSPAAISLKMEIDCAGFEQEAQAAGALNHPTFLPSTMSGMHDGAP